MKPHYETHSSTIFFPTFFWADYCRFMELTVHAEYEMHRSTNNVDNAVRKIKAVIFKIF